jgi:putative transposase
MNARATVRRSRVNPAPKNDEEFCKVAADRLEVTLPYWQLFYHAVWATWQREPLLVLAIEPVAHGLIRNKALELGAKVFAVNGMEDHVHLIVAVPPKIALALFIGQVKGATTARLNRSGGKHPFAWQDEYSVHSLDAKRLPYHVAYVQNQKTHHSQHSVIPALERTGKTD